MPDSTTAPAADNRLDCVQAEISFVARQPGPSGPFAPSKVTIRNARPMLNELSLDREGFTLARHAVSCLGETDPEAFSKAYWSEMTAFIQDHFKTSWVEPVYGPIIERRSRLPITHSVDGTEIEGVRATAGVAHLDYAKIAGPMLAARHSQMRGVPIRSYSRLMIVNTWRVTTPPPQDFPLAVCDATSFSEDDMLLTEFTEPETGVTWKNGAAYYNENQRWWYFADMTPDEVLVFKGFDTQTPLNLAHGAFDNRAASPEAGPRASLEARFYVYYE